MKEIDNALGHASVLKNKQISQGVQASASFHHCFIIITIMIVTQQGRTRKNTKKQRRTKMNSEEEERTRILVNLLLHVLLGIALSAWY